MASRAKSVARYTLLLCASSPQTLARETLAEAFSLRRFELVDTSPDNLRSALERHHPDAIIAESQPAVAHLYRDLAGSGGGNAPLRLLLPPAKSSALSSVADAVLSADARGWEAQVVPLLRMRAQMMALRQENSRLQSELANLRSVEGAPRPDPELELLKGFYVHNIAHELKTPLLQVKTAVQSLRGVPPVREDATGARLLDFAIQATARLEDVIQNISQVAQSMKISLDAIAPGDSVDFALRGVRNSWKHSSSMSRIQTAIEPGLPAVLADKRALGVALLQLLDNALKFSEGSVGLSVTREQDHVRFEITDSGIGIPSEYQARIFELFFQVDASSTRRYGGAGVGLAIVRLILDRHHAQIRVTSSPGAGTSISFALPVVRLTAEG